MDHNYRALHHVVTYISSDCQPPPRHPKPALHSLAQLDDTQFSDVFTYERSILNQLIQEQRQYDADLKARNVRRLKAESDKHRESSNMLQTTSSEVGVLQPQQENSLENQMPIPTESYVCENHIKDNVEFTKDDKDILDELEQLLAAAGVTRVAANDTEIGQPESPKPPAIPRPPRVSVSETEHSSNLYLDVEREKDVQASWIAELEVNRRYDERKARAEWQEKERLEKLRVRSKYSGENVFDKLLGMGFDEYKLGSAREICGNDEKKMLDFLLNADNLCDNNFPFEDVKYALEVHPESIEKATNFLKAFVQLTDIGFKRERIREALLLHDNRTGLAVEYLMNHVDDD
eukprot:CFRG7851T1